MILRHATKADQNAMDVADDAMLACGNFTVDGYDGLLACCSRDYNDEFVDVAVMWLEGNTNHEVQLRVADQTTGNLVLSMFSAELSSQALTALGFVAAQ